VVSVGVKLAVIKEDPLPATVAVVLEIVIAVVSLDE
jgi:hypothetical protein